MTEAPAPHTLHVVVTGCAGRMGRMLAQAVVEADGMQLSGALERAGHDLVGQDAGRALGFGRDFGFAVSDDPLTTFAQTHAVLDFTTPQATLDFAEIAAQARLVHVVGTTGMEAAQLERLALCARHATVIRAGNMSLGVNLLTALTRKVAASLGPEWDVEIAETHHRWKVDAPSGTALMLGEAAAEGREVALEEMADRGRDGQTGARRDGAIGFSVQRGGDVVGEHDVTFFGAGERIRLSHIATDRMLFARGACQAARWGQGEKPGLYDMMDVLGLSGF